MPYKYSTNTETEVKNTTDEMPVTESVIKESKSNTNYGKIVNCDTTYIRNNPDFGAHIIGILKKDTRVEIINDIDSKFYYIKSDKLEGYCAKQFIERG